MTCVAAAGLVQRPSVSATGLPFQLGTVDKAAALGRSVRLILFKSIELDPCGHDRVAIFQRSPFYNLDASDMPRKRWFALLTKVFTAFTS